MSVCVCVCMCGLVWGVGEWVKRKAIAGEDEDNVCVCVRV